MKRIIAVFLMIVMCAALFAVPFGAVPAPVLCGDMNYDSTVDIIDATLIQRYLIDLYECYMAEVIGDFDHDGEVNVIDATWIQRLDAHIDIPKEYGGIMPDISINSFEASILSGEAYIDTPVTFTAAASTSGSFIAYEFYIDGTLVQSRSEQNMMIHTFHSRGRYTIEVRAYTDWGVNSESALYDYKVKDGTLYDNPPYISVSEILNRNSAAPILHVTAKGGTAPYTYRFVLLRNTGEFYDLTGLTDEDIETYEQYIQAYGETDWQLGEQDGMTCLFRDYAQSNEIAIPKQMLPYSENYSRQISVRDANGIPCEQSVTNRYVNSQ